MEFPVYNTIGLVNRLVALNAAAYPLAPNQATARLYKNDVAPDIGMTIGTFVEADFDGYAVIPLTVGTPTLNDQGLVNSRSQLLTWNTIPDVATQTIHGIYITDESGEIVIAAQRFDDPQNVGGALPQSISGVWRTSEPLSSMGWLSVE